MLNYFKNNLYNTAIASLVLVSLAGTALAQKKKNNGGNNDEKKDDYVNQENVLIYDDHIYKKNIRTVQLHRADWAFATPLIKLNAGEQLKLSFDDLDGDAKTYSYTFIHCDADWKPSNILNSDYLTGFYDELISNRKYSFNTLQKYTHYELLFPTENLQITKSGNYILEVFTDYNKENVVLTRRFMVLEEQVDISAKVRPATNMEDRNYKQEVDFIVYSGAYPITNPYGDLKIVLMQNDRWDNALTGLKPAFVKDKELDYDLGDGNVFNGGNEFRRFDAKSLRYHSERISDIFLDSVTKKYFVQLLPDEKRAVKRYSSEIDINGHYKVYVQESRDNNETEADYIYVRFILNADLADKDGVFYIFGELSDWQYKPEFKMKFNPDIFAYECTAYLKQGYYNYEYVYLKDGEKVADDAYIEGTHWETENDYTILVYNREQGTMYDKLVGARKKNSVRNN